MTHFDEIRRDEILEAIVYLIATWDFRQQPVWVLNSNLASKIGQEKHIPSHEDSHCLPYDVFGIELEYNEYLPDDVIGIKPINMTSKHDISIALRDIKRDWKTWQTDLKNVLPEPNGEFKFEGNDYFRI